MSKIIRSVGTYRSALKRVFFLHIIMFFVALSAVIIGRSTSVLADALDFIGDAANYALSLFILNSTIVLRASISIAKAITMIVFCIPVVLHAIINFSEGHVPDHEIMSWAGMAGIIAHIYCIRVLYKFRTGDSNRLSVWVCTINDLLSNIITLAASQIVRFTDSMIPDIVAAGVIVCISIVGAILILKQATREIRTYRAEKKYA